MKPDKIRLGFVGAGLMGQSAHLRNYASLEDCEVVALAEPRAEIRNRVARKYGIARVYANATEMLETGGFDGLVASQQFTRHGIVVSELLGAGVPVFIEKPLAANLPTAEALAAADAKAGGKVVLGYHKRSDPATLWAKQEIVRLQTTGEVGRLKYIRVTMPVGHWSANGAYDVILDSSTAAPADRDRDDPALSEADSKAFFFFVNFYIHQLNLLRHLLGEDYTLSYVDPSGVVLVGHGVTNRVPVVLEMDPYSTGFDWQESALVAFERGFVRINYPAPLVLNRAGTVEAQLDPKLEPPSMPPYPFRLNNAYSPVHPWGSGRIIQPKLPNDHAMRVQAVNFLRFIRGESTPLCGSAEALEDMRVARTWLKLAKGV